MLNGKLVEVHLLNGKRFLGKITSKDGEGLVMYCIPVKALETVPPGSGALDEMREMLHTVFFPWQQVEYVDIGGEPIGFDSLYSSWFRGQPVANFFERPFVSDQERGNGET
ncbi:MAG TPA: hypothetical protein PK878_07360 [bacterium]|nr:hypothetical protein [Candidatus Omnitrophota bacterium]HOJ60091.1 hypothetical protein [bacterium]HOL94950.1 hypothetical protein [bacterium]HPP02206.1 hypothetical protein [bacterium]HXK95447.1 hypothetical protein [bacterium]